MPRKSSDSSSYYAITNSVGMDTNPYSKYSQSFQISDEDRTIYGTKRYGESQEERPAPSDEVIRSQIMGGSLHTGGGNEALRDYGIAFEEARNRGRYARDTQWLESIIPSIEGRSNIIPKIRRAREQVAERVSSERQIKLSDIEKKIILAETKVNTIKEKPITVPEKTYGHSWAPLGLYNNEYQYAQSEKTVGIAKAEAELRELENLKKNYEEDIDQAKNLDNLLKAYEKGEKYKFLGDYESRTASKPFTDGGPIVPAMTPSGTLKVSMPREGGKAVSFNTSKPFEDRPMRMPKMPRYKDRIMEQFNKKEIPIGMNPLKMTGDMRINTKKIFGNQRTNSRRFFR